MPVAERPSRRREAPVREERGSDELPLFAVTAPGLEPLAAAELAALGVRATVVANASTPDDVVYALVKAVFENFDDFKKLHPAFAKLDPKEMVKAGLSAPLHPGAERYYKEKGWL